VLIKLRRHSYVNDAVTQRQDRHPVMIPVDTFKCHPTTTTLRGAPATPRDRETGLSALTGAEREGGYGFTATKAMAMGAWKPSAIRRRRVGRPPRSGGWCRREEPATSEGSGLNAYAITGQPGLNKRFNGGPDTSSLMKQPVMSGHTAAKATYGTERI